MPRIYLKPWLILLLMAVYQSKRVKAILHDAPNIYHWMERNSYICDPFIPSKPDNPIFIFEEEAEIFRCATLCGDPIETKKACGRMRSQPDSDPSCFTIPEICIKEYIHEFTTTSHNGEKVDEVKENFDFETKKEVNQNNLEPVDLAVVNEPIVSNNAETNANEVQTSNESTTTSTTTTTITPSTTTPPSTTTRSTTTTTTTESTTTTTSTVPITTSTTTTPSTTTTIPTTTHSSTTTGSTTISTTTLPSTTTSTTPFTTASPTTERATTTTTTVPTTTSPPTTPLSTTSEATSISTTTAPPTTIKSTTIATTTLPPPTTVPTTTTTSSSSTTTSTTTATSSTTNTQSTSPSTTTTISSTTTSPQTTTVTTTTISATPTSTTTTPLSTTAVFSTTTIPTTTTSQFTTTNSPSAITFSSTTTTLPFTRNVPTTTRINIFSNPASRTQTFTTSEQIRQNVLHREPIQQTKSNIIFNQPLTTQIPPVTFVRNVSAFVSVFVTLQPTNAAKILTTTSSPSIQTTPTTRIFTTLLSTSRFIPTTTKVPSPSITTTSIPLTSEFTTQLNNAQIALIQNLEKHTRLIPAATSTVITTTQPPTRSFTSLFFTTPLFSRSQSTQTSQQQPSRFFQQQSTTRFIPVTTTVPSTTPLPSTRSHSTTPTVASSRFSNPQRTTTFQQSVSSAVNQQPLSRILSSSPLTTKSTASSETIGTTNLPSTTTTPTAFIQPIEQTTPRRPFGRFVLSEAKAVDLKDLRNRTGIFGKIIKQQKIFDELIRDSTLTTRNLPFTTPGEDKLIVDKRLQKLDETVKRFRTATPLFGFQLVSSISTKRPTRSTTQFLSTQLLGRNDVAAHGVVDRDLINPTTSTFVPLSKTPDQFKKFERILPKRIMGNDFKQIVFPTTTSKRFTRSTTATSKDSNLLIVDGQAFGEHFVFNSLPQPDLQDVIFGKVPTISSSSTSLSPVTIPLSSAKSLLPLKERNRQLKRKIFFFRNRHSGEMVIAPQDDECVDGDTACDFWAKNGECKANPVYMLTVCRLSCHICIPFYS